MYKKTTLFQMFVRRRTAVILLSGLLTVALGLLASLALAQTTPVTVEKSVDPAQLQKGEFAEYTVVFTNATSDPVDLLQIRDTLPAGFSFAAMGNGDIVSPPVGLTGTILWNGPYTVPGNGTLTLIYSVLVDAPPSATPYLNHVAADLSSGDTISAEVGITVLGPQLSCTKTAYPAMPADRSPVAYTVIIANSGSGAATIDSIVDTLPGEFEFLNMVSGPLPEPGPQQGQKVTWTGPFDVPAGGNLQFSYQAKADGTVGLPHANSLTATYNGLTMEPCQATIYLKAGHDYLYVPLVIKSPIIPTPTPPPPVVRRLAFDTKPADNYEVMSIEIDGTDLVNISNRTGGDANANWSPNGARIAWQHYGGNAEIYVSDANGANSKNVTNNDSDDQDPRWSPDGTRILFRSQRSGRWDIFVMNADGSSPNNLTDDLPCVSTMAKWSPDGARIGFICGEDANAEVYVMNADGTSIRQLTDDDDKDAALNWSPNNANIVYVRVPTDADSEIWVVDANSGTRTKLTNNSTDDFAPMYSPDGTKIIFTHEYDTSQVAVMNADGSGMVNLSNSTAGDFVPQWSPDGLYVAFLSNRDGNKELYVMKADGSNQFRLTDSSVDELRFDWWPIVP